MLLIDPFFSIFSLTPGDDRQKGVFFVKICHFLSHLYVTSKKNTQIRHSGKESYHLQSVRFESLSVFTCFARE